MISRTICHPPLSRRFGCQHRRLKAVRSLRILPFIPSSLPLTIYPGIRHTRVTRKQHSPALFARSAEDPPRAEKDWDSCLFPGNQKNYPSLHLSLAVLCRRPTSRGLRRVQGWQLPPRREAPSSRFLRILTPSLLSPSISFSSPSPALYRHSQFHLCIFYHSLSECLIRRESTFFLFLQSCFFFILGKMLSILSDVYRRRLIIIQSHDVFATLFYSQKGQKCAMYTVNSSYLDAKRQTTLGDSRVVRHLECSPRDRRYSRSRNEMSKRDPSGLA